MKKVLIIFPIITFGLGSWQVYRLQWKLDLIDKLKDKKYVEAIDYPLNLNYEEAEKLEYTNVRVKGEFDNNKEMYLGPKSNNGANGVHLIVPFKVQETGKYILVNRGWMPTEMKDPKTRENGIVRGPTQVEGYIRKKPQQGKYTPDNKNSVNDNFWYFIEPEKMLPNVGYDLIVIEEKDVEENPHKKTKYPIGGATNFEIRNPHLEYAVTWYASSLAMLMFMFSKDKPNRGQQIFKSMVKK